MASPLPSAGPSLNTSANTTNEDITEILLNKLRGKKVVIPSLFSIFVGWPHEVNASYPRLKVAVENKLSKLLPSENLRNKVRDADPAMVVSMFWPHVDYSQLRILCYMVIWQGIFDDLVELYNRRDPQQSVMLRRDMKMFINKSLGIGAYPNLPETFCELSFAKNFLVVADAVWSTYNEEQRRRLRDCMHQYIDATAEEKVMIEAGRTPQWLEYWELRARVGGVGPLIGMLEFAAGGYLPAHFIESTEYKTACKSLDIIVSMTNDLVSVKKEIKAGFVFSALPILYSGLANGRMDMAVDHVTFRIKEAAASLGQALDTLSVRFSSRNVGPETSNIAKRVILSFRHIATGSLFWSLQCKRYGMAEHLMEDDSLEFTLE